MDSNLRTEDIIKDLETLKRYLFHLGDHLSSDHVNYQQFVELATIACDDGTDERIKDGFWDGLKKDVLPGAGTIQPDQLLDFKNFLLQLIQLLSNHLDKRWCWMILREILKHDSGFNLRSCSNTDYDQSFRLTLNSGDYVDWKDAVGKWRTCQVLDFSGDQICVGYQPNPSYNYTVKDWVSRYSEEIAPFNTEQVKQAKELLEFRQNMKVGDKVEYKSYSSVDWKNAVIIGLSEDEKYVELKIENAVTGTTKAPRDSNNIAPHGTNVRDFAAIDLEDDEKEYGSSPIPHDVIAVTRKAFDIKSSCYVELLNFFFGVGGFDSWEKLLQDEDSDVELVVLANMLKFIKSILPVLTCQFHEGNVYKLIELITKKMLNCSIKNLRGTSAEEVGRWAEGIVEAFERTLTEDERERKGLDFALQMGLRCFNTDILQLKLSGLKIISIFAERTIPSAYDNIGSFTATQMVQWIQTNKIFDVLFHPGTHDQVIKQSDDLIKFLIDANLLQESVLEQLWTECLNPDPIRADAACNVLKKCAARLRSATIIPLVELVRNSVNNLGNTSKDIFAVLKKYLSFQSKTSDASNKILDLLWETSCNDECDPVVKLEAKKYLGDILGGMSYKMTDTRDLFVEKCLKRISEGENVLHAMDLLTELMGCFTTMATMAYSSRPSQKQMATKWEDDYGLRGVIINELTNHKDEDFTMESEIINRLKFLELMLKCGEFTLDSTLIQSLWNRFVDNSNYSNIEENIKELHLIEQGFSPSSVVMDWLVKLMVKGKTSSLIDNVGINFLFTTFIEMDRVSIPLLSMKQFECFAAVMLCVNENAGNVRRTKTSRKDKSITFLWNFEVTNQDILGIDMLWQIVTQIKNEEVGEKSIAFLNRFMDLAIDVPDRAKLLQDMRSRFLEGCMMHLAEAVKDNESTPHMETYHRIDRCLSFLKRLIQQSELNGDGGLRPHRHKVKGHKVIIKATLASSCKLTPKCGRSVTFSMQQHDPLWKMRAKIGAKMGLSLATMIVDFKRIIFSGDDNHKTLQELGFKAVTQGLSDDPIKNCVLISRHSDGVWADVCDKETNELTPDGKKALQSIYDKYKDEADLFGKSSIGAFFKDCGANESAYDDHRLNEIFKECPFVNHNGEKKLAEEGFFMFYRNAWKTRPSTVKHDLLAMGFRPDLKREEEVASAEQQAFAAVKGEDLPRSMLSRNDAHFNLLMNILNQLSESSPTDLSDDCDTLRKELVSSLWELILHSPTNISKQSSIISVADSGVEWSKILNVDSLHELMYSLLVIESIVEPFEVADQNGMVTPETPKNPDEEVEESKEEFAFSPSPLSPISDTLDSQKRECWRECFLNEGGFQHLFNLLTEKLGPVENEDGDSAKLRAQCCVFSLKLIRFFILGAISSVTPDLAHVVKLVKQTSKKDLDDNVEDESNGESTSDFRTLVRSMSDPSVKISAQKLLDNINFSDLQKLVINIINSVVLNVMSIEDESLVTYSMSLWCCITLYRPELTEELFDETSTLSPSFVLYCLSCTSETIRTHTVLTLTRLASSYKVPFSAVPSPRMWLLELLSNHLPSPEIGRLKWNEFFDLLCKMITMNNCDEDIAEDYSLEQELFDKCLVLLGQWPVCEMSADCLDTAMTGLLRVANTLCMEFPSLVTRGRLLIKNLWSEFLFPPLSPPEGVSEEDFFLLPKCKHDESRKMCMDFVLTLTEDENARTYINDQLWQFVSELNGITRDDKFNADGARRSTRGFVGLRNMGCICYMNSVLQQLFMIPVLRKGILSAPSGIVEGSKPEEMMVPQLQKLFAHLALSQRQAHDPLHFIKTYKDPDGQPVDVRVQQDAQEFLTTLLDRVEYSLKDSESHKDLIKDVLTGKWCNQLICETCKESRNSSENFYCIGVDVMNKSSLEDSMMDYRNGETISGCRCDHCDKNTPVTTKRALLDVLPNTMIIHLKRFEFDYQTFERKKIDSHFDFPSSLDLRPFSVDGGDDESSEKPNRDPSYYDYELAGVVVHFGSAQMGHYYSFIKNREDTNEMDNWNEYNDKLVSRFDFETLAEKCFGGETKSAYYSHYYSQDKINNAYMLVYERKKPIPLPKTTAELDTRTLMDCIPTNLIAEVKADSFAFGQDCNAFSPAFMNFVIEMLIRTPINEEENGIYLPLRDCYNALQENQHIVSRTLRFISLLIENSSSTLDYTSFINALLPHVKGNSYTSQMVAEYMYLQPEVLRQLLLNSRYEECRKIAYDFFVEVLKCLLPYVLASGGDIMETKEWKDVNEYGKVERKEEVPVPSASAYRLIMSFVDCISHVPSRDSDRGESLFSLLLAVAKHNFDDRMLLMRCRIIPKLFEYMDSSPSESNYMQTLLMASSTAEADYSKPLELTSIMTRACFCKGQLFGNDNEYLIPVGLRPVEVWRLDEIERGFLPNIVRNNGGYSDVNRVPIHNGMALYRAKPWSTACTTLPNTEKVMLMDIPTKKLFLNKVFYKKMLNNPKTAQSCAEILAHWSNQWPDFGGDAADCFLTSMKRADMENLSDLYKHLRVFLFINDDFLRRRLDDIFFSGRTQVGLVASAGIIQASNVHMYEMLKLALENSIFFDCMTEHYSTWKWMAKDIAKLESSNASADGLTDELRDEMLDMHSRFIEKVVFMKGEDFFREPVYEDDLMLSSSTDIDSDLEEQPHQVGQNWYGAVENCRACLKTMSNGDERLYIVAIDCGGVARFQVATMRSTICGKRSAMMRKPNGMSFSIKLTGTEEQEVLVATFRPSYPPIIDSSIGIEFEFIANGGPQVKDLGNGISEAEKDDMYDTFAAEREKNAAELFELFETDGDMSHEDKIAQIISSAPVPGLDTVPGLDAFKTRRNFPKIVNLNDQFSDQQYADFYNDDDADDEDLSGYKTPPMDHNVSSPVHNTTSTATDNPSPSVSQVEIACPVCTFLNNANNTNCEICYSTLDNA
eukprot:TRINITY_DN132330_c1_g2_i1.p1 TRINITY_DN132330_c1_g2~~TRINITY_DN132330_c1_g2_i1.p1  ORF type:complete len:2929 (-),score=891.17 TRINITY_DN132330_c1_g2_i1:193-8979(-)